MGRAAMSKTDRSRWRRCLLTAALATPAACRSSGVRPVPATATEVDARCVYRAGGAPGTLLVGPFLPPDGVAASGALFAADGVLQEVDRDAAALARRHPGASSLTCEGVVLSPGFVNAHEHLAYSYAFPDARLAPVYAHRDEWRDGLPGKPRLDDPPRRGDPATVAWVELRHLLGGATTVAGGGHVPGLAKNVDRSPADAASFVADVNTSPFGSATERFRGLDCAYAGPLPPPTPADYVPSDAPFVAHVGEGTNCVAALEIESFLRDAAAAPARRHTIVHGLAVRADQRRRLAAQGVAIVWSPRSNLALYGRTLDPAALLDDDVLLALGTDWSPTGSYTMLGELQCADAYARARAVRPLTGRELWRMATAGGAEALGIRGVTGAIEPGLRADLVILRDPHGRGVADIGRLTADDVVAVLVDGHVEVADRRFVGGDALPGCSAAIGDKQVCADLAPLGIGFAALLEATRAFVQPLSTDRQAPCAF
jgi:cytosine/adenosine deaminase-related metal-dependent hydrolase